MVLQSGEEVRALIHEAEEGGYWAEVPQLPGCFTEADTLDELKANLREAIELYLESPDELCDEAVI